MTTERHLKANYLKDRIDELNKIIEPKRSTDKIEISIFSNESNMGSPFIETISIKVGKEKELSHKIFHLLREERDRLNQEYKDL